MAHFMCRKHGQHFLMALFRVPHQDYGTLYLKQYKHRGHSLPLSSLLKQHFNPYKMSLTMILNDIQCVKLSLKPLL